MSVDPYLPRNASVFSLRCKDNNILSVLIVDEKDGTSRIIPEVIALMSALISRGESLSKMRGIANTLALLYDYIMIVRNGEPVIPEKLPEIISAFLRRRRQVPTTEDGLLWPPVKRETVERDKNYLKIFSEFCAMRYGHFPIVPLHAECVFREDGASYRDVMRYLSRKNNMLLGHIAGPKPGIPSIGIKEIITRRRSNGRTFMSSAMIEDLILSTQSLSQKMAFIQAAFGGQRISEILNMWRCDVLPGMYRPTLFPDDVTSDIPLLILAHPSQSRYIGETGPGGSNDRLQHLSKNYKLQPRNLIVDSPLKAGWKGMLFDNYDLLISQVFWSDRGWAQLYYKLYKQLRDEVIFNVDEKVRNSHPYLIINDSFHRAEFGQPMKMSNIRKAFSRACTRIGIDEMRFQEGIHGLRHSYKANLEKLGLSPEEIRKAMHHLSISSQHSYGQSAALLNQRMNNLLKTMGSNESNPLL